MYVRAARGGHIPRALNIDWESNLTIDGRFKGIDDLKYVYPFDKVERLYAIAKEVTGLHIRM